MQNLQPFIIKRDSVLYKLTFNSSYMIIRGEHKKKTLLILEHKLQTMEIYCTFRTWEFI